MYEYSSYDIFGKMVKIRTKKCICMRCGYRWSPRSRNVNRCAGCNSPYWNMPLGVLKRGRPIRNSSDSLSELFVQTYKQA